MIRALEAAGTEGCTYNDMLLEVLLPPAITAQIPVPFAAIPGHGDYTVRRNVRRMWLDHVIFSLTLYRGVLRTVTVIVPDQEPYQRWILERRPLPHVFIVAICQSCFYAVPIPFRYYCRTCAQRMPPSRRDSVWNIPML